MYITPLPCAVLQPYFPFLGHLSPAYLVTTASVVLDPGQTCPSACRVSAGQKVNGLTDLSVERVKQVLGLDCLV
jgi:hypothetical protein